MSFPPVRDDCLAGPEEDPFADIDLDAAVRSWGTSPARAGGNEGRRGEHLPADPPTRRPVLVRLADVMPGVVKWLWKPYLPAGKLTLLEGDPKVGKSWLAMNLAAIISRGDPFPSADGVPRERRDPAAVVYLSAEDSLDDTVRPRLDAAGADASRVFALTGIELCDPATGDRREAAVTLADVDVLDKVLTEVRPALVVVDPLQAFFGAGIDFHRANEVRPVLAGLGRLAERHGCAILAIRHLTKGNADRALYRGLGSIDFAAAARSILLAGKDPEAPERRVLVHLACSNAPEGPSLGYELREGLFVWTGTSPLGAGDLLAPDRNSEEEQKRGAVEEAVEFLRQVLADGPVDSKEVDHQRKVAGVAWATIRRAKDQLGVRSRRLGFGPGATWTWALPDSAQPGAAGA
ncbi:MAG: AAA family ATPase [Deltaproteobacteria bacterium]|nr:AAA family ATPase [Deltaproteobacteria bacterium]